MPTLFIGLLALILVVWLLKSFARSDPRALIKIGRTVELEALDTPGRSGGKAVAKCRACAPISSR